MRRTFAVSGMVVALGFAVVTNAAAAVSDTFMLVPGIPGESIDARHADWIDVLSLSQSWAPEGKKGNPCLVQVIKPLDIAGPKLWAAAVTGQIFPQIQIDIVRAGAQRQRYYEIKLTGAFIASISTSGDDMFAETLTLSAPTVTLSYYPQRADGSLGPPVVSTLQCN